MNVPVDARYFPRGGLCDAEPEAMEVFNSAQVLAKLVMASFQRVIR